MQARANYYVPGVMALLAITPIPFGATEGPVALAPDAEWGLPHPDDRTGGEKPIEQGARWVLMACELAERQSLMNWVKRLDAKTQHGIQVRRVGSSFFCLLFFFILLRPPRVSAMRLPPPLSHALSLSLSYPNCEIRLMSCC